MSKIRETGTGYTYHISTRCVDQTYLLHKEELKAIVLNVIEKAKKKYDFYCFGFTIMDNHIHLIIQTPEEDNISIIMQVINKNIATQGNKLLDRTGHFWGSRFHSTLIKSEEQLINTLIYLDLNPVKAGLVYDPKDWAWGSYNEYVNHHTENSIVDIHPFFTETDNIQALQEYYKNLVLERRQEIIVAFLYEKGFILENAMLTQEYISELLVLYQKIQSKTWNDTISKRRTPKEFL